MNKLLIKLYIPAIGMQYDLWISKKSYIYEIINLIVRGLKDLTYGEYDPRRLPNLYDKKTGLEFDPNSFVENVNIVNGSELILI